MGHTHSEWEFNFGPIARTEASGIHDTFNLAALPLHVSLDALMAATDRDEFVAWLWHDLFKPVFYFVPKAGGGFSWIHIPGESPFEKAEQVCATATNIPLDLVKTHHKRYPHRKLRYGEAEIIEDQFDQTSLGRSARFVQLSLAVEPSMSTAVVRAVIADSFMEAVTKSVAQALQKTLESKEPSFSRVRFVFETRGGFATPLPETAIWNEIGQHFDVQLAGDELLVRHVTPVNVTGRFDTQTTVDLHKQALTPEQMSDNILGLAELLVAYQDSRTVVMSVPQPQICNLNTNQLTSEVLKLTRAKLKALDIRTVKDDVDLLAAGFDAQVEIREVPASLGTPPDSQNPRPLSLIRRRPAERLDDAKSGGRHCRLCASAFESNLPAVDLTRPDFTDAEHIGFTGDLCPLCRLYWYNTHQYTQDEKTRGAQGMRKALRGSFALVLPSSPFDVQDQDCELIERPPLDMGGRFDLTTKPLQRVTVTQQEFALFTQISRRVVAQLWRQIESAAALPLPYLGGILLTHREADLVRKVLPALRGLFAQVTLLAYPFEAKVVPSVELALEVALADFKQHHTKHTFLKSRPVILPVHPDSRLFVLADNAMQIEINRAWFEAHDRIASLVNQISGSQRKEWMRRIADGEDPATALYESTQTRLKHSDDGRAFNTTAAFWATQFGEDPARAWSGYERERDDLRETLSRYPMLTDLFPVLTERKETEDVRSDTTDTRKEANGSSAGRGIGRHRRHGSSKRSRARRQTGG